jgi:predicted transcriptional regulator
MEVFMNQPITPYKRAASRTIKIIMSNPGIHGSELAGYLGISRSAASRLVVYLRNNYKAPIKADATGYYWRPTEKELEHAKAIVRVFC